jgi:biopolymer transport protein ExbB
MLIHGLFQFFLKLGSEWVLWLLLALAVLVVGIILNRMRSLSAQEKVGARFWTDQLSAWVEGGKKPADLGKSVETWASQYPCVETRVLKSLVGGAEPHKRASALLTSERLKLESFLGILGTLGNNAPFIGLFGTVIGIIRAFHDLGGGSGEGGSGGIQTVGVGLSEALVATAVGLMVAIPAVFYFNYFNKKVKAVMTRVEGVAALITAEK